MLIKSEKLLFLVKTVIVSLLIVAAALSFFYIGKVLFDKPLLEVVEYTGDRVTVVIDAGHGGIDSGATVGEVREKDLNLKVAKQIAVFLEYYDVDVYMTRSDDKLLAQDSSKHKKRDDLLNRVSFANQFNDPVFVSIHMNKFAEGKYNGLQVFYSPNNQYSEALALVLQSNNKEFLEPHNARNIKKSTDSIYVLDRLQCSAVLIECGFLSNDEDLSKLSDEEYQKKLAFVIANSIIEYIKL